MILVMLTGNTNTRIYLFRGRRVFSRSVVPTRSFLARPGRWIPQGLSLSDAAYATVVRQAARKCFDAIRARTGIAPFMPDEQSETGLSIHYNRKQLGQDRLCVAVGARAKYPGNLVILDFGTAVTVNIVTERGIFMGGPIIPGQDLMLESLHRTRARLPLVKPGERRRPVCRDTESALVTGTRLLLCKGIQDILRMLTTMVGGTFTIVATGGAARAMRPDIPGIDRVDPDLAARGLLELCLMNQKKTKKNGRSAKTKRPQPRGRKVEARRR